MKPAAAIEEHSFRGEPAITLRAGELAATFVPGVGMTGVSLRYRGREHLALPGGLDALRRAAPRGCPCSRHGATGSRLAVTAPRASTSTFVVCAWAPTTTDCLSTDCSWARPDGGSTDRSSAVRPAAHHVDRRRRARVSVPPPHRAGDRRARRDPRHRYHDRSHRAAARARRVRLAPVPEGSGYPAGPLAPAAARAYPLGARPARGSPRARPTPSHARQQRSAGEPSTTSTSSGGATASRTRARTAPRSRCTVDAAIRTRRSGCRRANRSPRSSR